MSSIHKMKLDEKGNLTTLDLKGSWQFMVCPFRPATIIGNVVTSWSCGTSCPHFNLLEGGVVELTCGGRERMIYLGGANVAKDN